MKKNYLLMAGFASLMAFSACSNDDDLAVPSTPVFENDGTVFEIAISNTGEGTTKATRPMGSSSAANQVNTIKLAVFERTTGTNNWERVEFAKAPVKDSEIDFEGSTTGFSLVLLEGENLATPITTPQDLYNDQEENLATINYDNSVIVSDDAPTATHISRRATIKAMGLEKNKEYRFVAYGYNENASNTKNTLAFNAQTDGSNPTTFFTATETLSTTDGNKGTVYDYEEIFAASATTQTITRTEDTEDIIEFARTPSLTLTRQVAGILAYIENIPCRMVSEYTGVIEPIEKIEVVANRKAVNNFTIPNKLLSQYTNNNGEDFNGGTITGEAPDVLMTFIMANCATTDSYKDRATSDEVYDIKANAYAEGYVAPTTPTGFTTLPGTIFGARYLMPYDQHYETAETTLEIKIYTLKENKEAATAAAEDWVLISTIPVRSNTSDNHNLYDIRCNNFYSIGKKLTQNNGDHNDKPISLTSDEVNVQVNSAWAVLHDMELQ